MAKRFTYSMALAALPALALLGSGMVPQAHAAPVLVKTASAQILVNARGMTLYLFTPDKHDKSVCTGECAEYWPPLLLPKGMAKPPAVPGVPGTFGVARRAEGTRQLTYDGAPLYTFVKDKKPGDMTGQGVQGVWWVVVAGTGPARATTSTNGGGGQATSTPQAAASAATATPQAIETQTSSTPTTTTSAPPTPTPYYRGGDGGYGADG